MFILVASCISSSCGSPSPEYEVNKTATRLPFLKLQSSPPLMKSSNTDKHNNYLLLLQKITYCENNPCLYHIYREVLGEKYKEFVYSLVFLQPKNKPIVNFLANLIAFVKFITNCNLLGVIIFVAVCHPCLYI